MRSPFSWLLGRKDAAAYGSVRGFGRPLFACEKFPKLGDLLPRRAPRRGAFHPPCLRPTSPGWRAGPAPRRSRHAAGERLRNERFHPRRATHPQPERSAMRFEHQLEAQKGTATALRRDELQQVRHPPVIAREPVAPTRPAAPQPPPPPRIAPPPVPHPGSPLPFRQQAGDDLLSSAIPGRSPHHPITPSPRHPATPHPRTRTPCESWRPASSRYRPCCRRRDRRSG